MPSPSALALLAGAASWALLAVAASAQETAAEPAQEARTDAPVAEAPPQSSGERTVYPASWFARYAPANALDIASRAPGFTIENGEEVRGFAGAVGNVVINGARPSAKAETLQDILRRIPASQVVRVELMPGALVGAEYRSRSQVLNIVLAEASSGLSGSAEASLQRVYTGDINPAANLSILRRRGATSMGAAISYEDRPSPDYGYDLLTRRPSGALVERRDKTNFYHTREASLSGNWGWEPGRGTAAHLNGRVWRWENPLEHRSRVTGPNGPLRNDTIDQDPSRVGYEVGGDAAHALAGGVLKAVGLVRRERYQLEEEFRNRTPDNVLFGGIAQEVDNRTGETVGRLVWSHEGLFGWSFETGGEVALNTLDSDVDLFTLDATGARSRVPLPVSDVLVEEVRGEGFVSAGRKLGPDLSFDAGAAVETSTLTVSGDAEAERTLTFFKPRAALEWTPGGAWRLRASAERLVAQLNFDDFVSTAEIANDRVSSGNPEVEPERTWRLSGLVERRVLGEGKLRLTIYHDRIQMVQDRVPTPEGFDAPGNLGDGRRNWFEAVADLPMDKLYVPGGRFNLRWILQDSDVQDPYTLTGRYFSGEVPWSVTANFRQDLRSLNLAWGLDYGAEGESPQYRLNEIDIWNPDNDSLHAFVEYRPSPKTTVTLYARNLFDRDIVRTRTFFTPNRASLEPSAFEERRRWQGRAAELTVKRTFG